MIDLLKTVFKYKEKESPDRLGLYPEAIHTNAMPERRYLWSARLLVILACLSICFNLMLVSGIYLMLPLLDSGPALFYHDHTFSSFAPLEKQERPIAAIDLLTESFLRDYVLLRHVVTNDYDELKSRLPWIIIQHARHRLSISGAPMFVRRCIQFPMKTVLYANKILLAFWLQTMLCPISEHRKNPKAI